MTAAASDTRLRRLGRSIPGPVFLKEVWVIGKKRATAWVRTLFGLALLGVCGLIFLPIVIDSIEGTGTGIARFQLVAPQLTTGLLWCEFVLLALVGAAIGAGAISEERRAGTLAALLSTPITAWQIVLGKLLGRGAELMILALLGLPLLLGVRAFGGVRAESIAIGFLLVVLNALVITQTAILLSIRAKRAVGPFLSSLTFAAAIYFIPPLILVASVGINPGLTILGYSPQMLIFPSSTPFSLGAVTVGLNNGLMDESTIYSMALANAAWMGSLWALLFALSCLMLRTAMKPDAPAQPRKRVKVAMTPAPGAEAAAEGAAPARKRKTRFVERYSSREVGDRPVLWREFQQRIIGSKAKTITVTALVVTATLAIDFLAGLQVVQIAVPMIAFAAGIILAAASTSPAIAAEREGRTLEVLLTTPLSAQEIVRAKFLGAMRRMWVFPAFIAAHMLLTGPLVGVYSEVLQIGELTFPEPWRRVWNPDYVHPAAIPVVLLVFIPAMGMVSATGLALSAKLRRTTAASVVNIILMGAVWLALPLILMILGDAFDADGLQKIACLIWWTCPFVPAGAGMGYMDGSKRGFPFDPTPMEPLIEMPWPHGEAGFSYVEFFAYTVVLAGLYLGVVRLALHLAAKWLLAGTGRDR